MNDAMRRSSKHVYKPTITINCSNAFGRMHFGNALHRMANVLRIVHHMTNRAPIPAEVSLNLDVPIICHGFASLSSFSETNHLENHQILWYNMLMIFVF